MFESLSRQATPLGLPLIPVFHASGLPCVRQKMINEAGSELIQTSMRKTHPSKNACLSLDTEVEGGYFYYLAEILDARLMSTLPPSAMLGAKLIYKSRIEKNKKNYTIQTPQGEVLASVQSRGFAQIASAVDLPTPNQPVVHFNEKALRVALAQLGEIHFTESAQNSLPTTIAQMEYQIKSRNGRFVNDLLLKSTENTQILPVLHEIEAIYTQMASKLSISSDMTLFPVDGYIQHFFSLLSEKIHATQLKLHPEALKGIGANHRENYFVSVSPCDLQRDYEGFKSYALECMTDAVGSEQRMLVACQDIFDEMAVSTALSKIQLDQMKRFVSRQSGMKLNLSKIEFQIVDTRKNLFGLGSFGNTLDKAKAALSLTGDFCYDPDICLSLLRWSGAYWEVFDDGALRQFISNYFPSQELQRSASKVKDMCSALKKMFYEKPPQAQGVNFQNCYLDENLVTLPSDKQLGFTYAFDFEYKPELPEPVMFLAFLNDCFEHQPPPIRERNIELVQQTIAATLYQRGPALQKAVLLYGAGSTGKSQLLEIIKRLVPTSKTCAVAPDQWSDAVQARGLNDKLLNVCGELSETKSIDAQRFKDIVDGNPISHSTLSTSFTVTPVCTHWFASNHLPKSKDTTEGFSRRWLVLQFDNVVDPTKLVLDIGAKIAVAEKEQIVNWATKAITSLIKRQQYSVAPNDLESNIAQMNNNVRYFIETACTTSDLSWLKPMPRNELAEVLTTLKPLSLKYLYTKYSLFIKDMNCGAAIDEQQFIIRMRHLAALFGFMVVVGHDKRGRILVQYYGVSL